MLWKVGFKIVGNNFCFLDLKQMNIIPFPQDIRLLPPTLLYSSL
jgi:hypothetical protein